MFDTMTMTKVLGGVCGTLLVFLLGKWVAEEIYHSGGHGDHEQAYVIPVDNGTGPYLTGIVGRDVAASQGFNYSGNLIAVNDVWTEEELNAFLDSPRGYAPGTAMGLE